MIIPNFILKILSQELVDEIYVPCQNIYIGTKLRTSSVICIKKNDSEKHITHFIFKKKT